MNVAAVQLTRWETAGFELGLGLHTFATMTMEVNVEKEGVEH